MEWNIFKPVALVHFASVYPFSHTPGASLHQQIWVRNYQILEQQAENALEKHLHKKKSGQEQATSLVEIGPRYVLDPIRIFRGSFGGQTLYLNENYQSPNEIRSLERQGKGNSYVARKNHQKKRKERAELIVVPHNPLDSVFD